MDGTLVTRDDVVTEARSWVKTPFLWHGTLKGIGVDCAGMIVGIMQSLGVKIPSRVSYWCKGGVPPRGDHLLKFLDGELGQRKTDRQPGDICVFRAKPTRGQAQHLAIATDGGIIHADARWGFVVEHHMDDKWTDRFVCAYGFPGVTDG